MKKSIIVVSALFLAASSAAVLCACGGGEKGTTEVAFASYESWQDGFYNINMMDGFGRISRSDEQVHGGSYSAKLQPLGSVTDPSAPYFYYPMQMDGEEGYSYADFSKLAKVSFYMYNAGSETEGGRWFLPPQSGQPPPPGQRRRWSRSPGLSAFAPTAGHTDPSAVLSPGVRTAWVSGLSCPLLSEAFL